MYVIELGEKLRTALEADRVKIMREVEPITAAREYAEWFAPSNEIEVLSYWQDDESLSSPHVEWLDDEIKLGADAISLVRLAILSRLDDVAVSWATKEKTIAAGWGSRPRGECVEDFERHLLELMEAARVKLLASDRCLEHLAVLVERASPTEHKDVVMCLKHDCSLGKPVTYGGELDAYVVARDGIRERLGQFALGWIAEAKSEHGARSVMDA